MDEASDYIISLQLYEWAQLSPFHIVNMSQDDRLTQKLEVQDN